MIQKKNYLKYFRNSQQNQNAQTETFSQTCFLDIHLQRFDDYLATIYFGKFVTKIK